MVAAYVLCTYIYIYAALALKNENIAHRDTYDIYIYIYRCPIITHFWNSKRVPKLKSLGLFVTHIELLADQYTSHHIGREWYTYHSSNVIRAVWSFAHGVLLLLSKGVILKDTSGDLIENEIPRARAKNNYRALVEH